MGKVKEARKTKNQKERKKEKLKTLNLIIVSSRYRVITIITKNSGYPKGWIEYDKYSNSKNGFHAKSFINGDYLVINFKGTDMRKPGGKIPSSKDLWDDIRMGINLQPNQIVDARIYYEKLKIWEIFPKEYW